MRASFTAAIIAALLLVSPALAQQGAPFVPPDTASGRISVGQSQTGTTGAVTATLPAAQGKTTYLCGYSVSALATAATQGASTITGLSMGTMNLIESVGATPNVFINSGVFIPCLPASAPNTAIVVNGIAPGAGGNSAISAWGYQY